MTALDLKRYALFADLFEEELELLEDLLEAVELDPGDQLFREGQEAEGLVLVERGRLALSSTRVGELGTLEAGEVLGALSLVAVGPREATARAEEATRVLRLSRTAFHRFAEDAPRAGVRVLEAVLTEMASAVRRGLDRLR